jgi:hypothetical protein
VEGNRIYIWDNNVPYPSAIIKDNLEYSYNQYISINIKTNTFVANYDWQYFDKISLVPLDQIYTDSTSPI